MKDGIQILIDAYLDGELTEEQHRALGDWLRECQGNVDRFVAECRLHSALLDGLHGYEPRAAHDWPQQPGVLHASPASPSFGPIVIETAPLAGAPLSQFGGFVFSYGAAVVIVMIGILIGWAYQVSVPRPGHQVAANTGPRLAPGDVHPKSEMVFVGRVTGMSDDCQWSDSKTATIAYAYVPLGRKYALASGLMQITYDSGAKVILQGPCTYQVDSKAGGYLSVGRLTARVEKKGAGGGGRGMRRTFPHINCQQSAITNLPRPAHNLPPPPPIPRPPLLFALPPLSSPILARSSASRSRNPARCDCTFSRASLKSEWLTAGATMPKRSDWTRTSRFEWPAAQEERFRSSSSSMTRRRSNEFVRQMPRRMRIELFNTGVGLKVGDADPHWQLVARSDDPSFKPRPARVQTVGNGTLENDPARSQWISLTSDESPLPDNVVYTFRTTFDLAGTLPRTAILSGRFIADDRVVAIRLNGRSLHVPPQHKGVPFSYWVSFWTDGVGFTAGANVLEIDVLNQNPDKTPSQRRHEASRMCVRVELEGVAYADANSGVSPTVSSGAESAAIAQERRWSDAFVQDFRLGVGGMALRGNARARNDLAAGSTTRIRDTVAAYRRRNRPVRFGLARDQAAGGPRLYDRVPIPVFVFRGRRRRRHSLRRSEHRTRRRSAHRRKRAPPIMR